MFISLRKYEIWEAGNLQLELGRPTVLVNKRGSEVSAGATWTRREHTYLQFFIPQQDQGWCIAQCTCLLPCICWYSLHLPIEGWPV